MKPKAKHSKENLHKTDSQYVREVRRNLCSGSATRLNEPLLGADRLSREARRSETPRGNKSVSPCQRQPKGSPDSNSFWSSHTSRQRTPESEKISHLLTERCLDGRPLEKHRYTWEEKKLKEKDRSISIVENWMRDVKYSYMTEDDMTISKSPPRRRSPSRSKRFSEVVCPSTAARTSDSFISAWTIPSDNSNRQSFEGIDEENCHPGISESCPSVEGCRLEPSLSDIGNCEQVASQQYKDTLRKAEEVTNRARELVRRSKELQQMERENAERDKDIKHLKKESCKHPEYAVLKPSISKDLGTSVDATFLSMDNCLPKKTIKPELQENKLYHRMAVSKGHHQKTHIPSSCQKDSDPIAAWLRPSKVAEASAGSKCARSPLKNYRSIPHGNLVNKGGLVNDAVDCSNASTAVDRSNMGTAVDRSNMGTAVDRSNMGTAVDPSQLISFGTAVDHNYLQNSSARPKTTLKKSKSKVSVIENLKSQLYGMAECHKIGNFTSSPSIPGKKEYYLTPQWQSKSEKLIQIANADNIDPTLAMLSCTPVDTKKKSILHKFQLSSPDHSSTEASVKKTRSQLPTREEITAMKDIVRSHSVTDKPEDQTEKTEEFAEENSSEFITTEPPTVAELTATNKVDASVQESISHRPEAKVDRRQDDSPLRQQHSVSETSDRSGYTSYSDINLTDGMGYEGGQERRLNKTYQSKKREEQMLPIAIKKKPLDDGPRTNARYEVGSQYSTVESDSFVTANTGSYDAVDGETLEACQLPEATNSSCFVDSKISSIPGFYEPAAKAFGGVRNYQPGRGKKSQPMPDRHIEKEPMNEQPTTVHKEVSSSTKHVQQYPTATTHKEEQDCESSSGEDLQSRSQSIYPTFPDRGSQSTIEELASPGLLGNIDSKTSWDFNCSTHRVPEISMVPMVSSQKLVTSSGMDRNIGSTPILIQAERPLPNVRLKDLHEDVPPHIYIMRPVSPAQVGGQSLELKQLSALPEKVNLHTTDELADTSEAPNTVISNVKPSQKRSQQHLQNSGSQVSSLSNDENKCNRSKKKSQEHSLHDMDITEQLENLISATKLSSADCNWQQNVEKTVPKLPGYQSNLGTQRQQRQHISNATDVSQTSEILDFDNCHSKTQRVNKSDLLNRSQPKPEVSTSTRDQLTSVTPNFESYGNTEPTSGNFAFSQNTVIAANLALDKKGLHRDKQESQREDKPNNMTIYSKRATDVGTSYSPMVQRVCHQSTQSPSCDSLPSPLPYRPTSSYLQESKKALRKPRSRERLTKATTNDAMSKPQGYYLACDAKGCQHFSCVPTDTSYTYFETDKTSKSYFTEPSATSQKRLEVVKCKLARSLSPPKYSEGRYSDGFDEPMREEDRKETSSKSVGTGIRPTAVTFRRATTPQDPNSGVTTVMGIKESIDDHSPRSSSYYSSPSRKNDFLMALSGRSPYKEQRRSGGKGRSGLSSGHDTESSDDYAMHETILPAKDSPASKEPGSTAEGVCSPQIDKLLAIHGHLKELLTSLEAEKNVSSMQSASNSENSTSASLMRENDTLTKTAIASLVDKIGGKMHLLASRLESKGEFPKANNLSQANDLCKNLAMLVDADKQEYNQHELNQLLTTVACSLLSLCVYLKQPCDHTHSPPPLRLRDQMTDTSSLSDVSGVSPIRVSSRPHIFPNKRNQALTEDLQPSFSARDTSMNPANKARRLKPTKSNEDWARKKFYSESSQESEFDSSQSVTPRHLEMAKSRLSKRLKSSITKLIDKEKRASKLSSTKQARQTGSKGVMLSSSSKLSRQSGLASRSKSLSNPHTPLRAKRSSNLPQQKTSVKTVGSKPRAVNKVLSNKKPLADDSRPTSQRKLKK